MDKPRFLGLPRTGSPFAFADIGPEPVVEAKQRQHYGHGHAGDEPGTLLAPLTEAAQDAHRLGMDRLVVQEAAQVVRDFCRPKRNGVQAASLGT